MTARSCLLLGALAVLPAGCGGGPTPVPVSGRVTLDNKPLANATLQFVPVAAAKDNTTQISSIGTTGEDGRYSLTLNTDGHAKGALVGKYKVMITLGAQSAADARPTFHKQLPERYNRKTELECEVPAGGRDDADFNLSSR
jgi:hypothetical protein